MTTYANPSNDVQPLAGPMGRVFKYSGHTDGFVVEGETLLADVDGVGLTAGPYDGFAKTGESGLDVQIGSGEGVLNGAIVARDAPDMVTLPPNESGPESTVVLAFDPAVESEVITDTDANVTENAGDIPRLPLYEFETDADSITAQDDVRTVGEQIDVQNVRYEATDGSGAPVDNANALGGAAATQYARLDQNEVIGGAYTHTDTLTVDSPQDAPAIQINGANDVDSDELVIDGDEDADQNDDLIKARSVNDPGTTDATDDDTKFVVKGEGLTGINRYNPTTALDVEGDTTLRGTVATTGKVTVNAGLEVQQNTDTQSVDVTESDDGARFAVADGGRFYIAPVVGGSSRFGSELTYQSAQDDWKFETPLDLPTGKAVGAESEYRIEKNGSDANGVINFKTG